ncbi:MAG: hypothetical protein IJN84_04040, partial [Clostridia bacterium]|nr:hypothetical protein [Clostridia bacterium]
IMICSAILSFDGFLGYVKTFWFTKVTICIVYIAAWLIFIILAKSKQNLYFALTCGIFTFLAVLPHFEFSLFIAIITLVFATPFSAISKYITNPFIAPAVCIIWIAACLIKLKHAK